MKHILLKTGEKAIVDDDTYDFLNKFIWRGTKTKYTTYVYSSVRSGGRFINLAMHRLITMCPNNLVVDHINHNALDNRRDNLRCVTNKVNCNNRRPDCEDYKEFYRLRDLWRKKTNYKKYTFKEYTSVNRKRAADRMKKYGPLK